MSAPYLGTNMSLDEALRYGTDADVRRMVEKEQATLAEARNEIADLNRRVELLEEQLFFARDLFETIEHQVDRYTKAKDIKEAVATAFADTSFER